MQRRTRIILLSSIGVVAVLAVSAAIFGPRIYRDAIAAKPSAVPTVEADALKESTLAVGDLPGKWSVRSGSWAGYRVNEVLNGTDVTVTGQGNDVHGSVTVTDTSVTEGEVTVGVASIATDQANRDNYFRNTTMNVAAHPTATFRITSPIALPTDPTAATTRTATVAGTLTLAGVTQDVSIDVTVGLSGNEVKLSGSIPVTFADFGIQAPDIGFVSVEDHGAVEFELTLTHD